MIGLVRGGEKCHGKSVGVGGGSGDVEEKERVIKLCLQFGALILLAQAMPLLNKGLSLSKA
jgi:hypothetical protein